MGNIHELTSREFEVLAANYAKSLFPHYQWKITKAIGDYNRDFEAVVKQLNKWGEAKLTENKATSVSKSRWDPTILSAVLKNDVDELVLVTSGWIPLEYVIRVCHLAEMANNISKVVFINGYIINEWLKTHKGNFDNFEAEGIDLNLKQITPLECDNNVKCVVQIYDVYNILEPKKEIYSIIPYKIYITFFVMSDSKINVSMPRCFLIKSVAFGNMSDGSEIKSIKIGRNNIINCVAKQGYNQIVISGTGTNDSCSDSLNKIEVSINGTRVSSHSIVFMKPPAVNELLSKQIINIEKERNNCLTFGNNSVIKVAGVDRNDITSITNQCRRFFYFHFNNSYCQNSVELCKALSLLLFGVYNNQGETKTVESAVNSTLNYCSTYLSNILIGTTDYIYAIESINELTELEWKYTTEKFMLPDKSTVFIEISDRTNAEILNLLETWLAYFRMRRGSSIVIISQNAKSDVYCRHPFFDQNEIKIIDEFNSQKCIKSKAVDELRKKANEYYESSDFFKAKFFYDIIFLNNSSDEYELNEVFKYADSLNHCDSMTRSKEMFAIAAQMSSKNDAEREIKILEAQTELFSLRFWSLDVAYLVDDIDRMIERSSNILLNDNCGSRALYAYYNCLNRKMVAQYLIGDYINAEVSFDKCVNCIKSSAYANYKAFAYMDSARGLYAKDLETARRRLIIAQEILYKLSLNNKEKRRYLDCNVELAYVEFLIEYEKGNRPALLPLESAVTKVRINGYRSMLIKCNLKLAACYLALGKTEESYKCLNYVKKSCNFKENPRVNILYNNLLSGYLSIMNYRAVEKYGITKEYQPKCVISFDINAKEKISIEPRLW